MSDAVKWMGRYERPWILARLSNIEVKGEKCYISGPMTGLPEFNVRSFERAEELLRCAAWGTIYNPINNDAEQGISLEGQSGLESPEGFDYKKAMKQDLWQVCDSDALFVLPGWEYSSGCLLEVHVAHRVGVPVYSLLSGRLIERPEEVPHEFSTRSPIVVKKSWRDFAFPRGERPWPLDFPSDEDQYVADEVAEFEGVIGTDPVTLTNVRQFETGATRDTDAGKPDYRGFLSPLVIKRFGEYMLKHQVQSDGSLRTSDNWKKGMPQQEYLSSLLRHVEDAWLIQEGYPCEAREGLEEALCGVLFNVSGWLHECVKARLEEAA